MVVVLVMHRELPQIFAAKLAATTSAYFGVQLQCLGPVALLALVSLPPSHLNDPVSGCNIVWCFLWRHACILEVTATDRARGTADWSDFNRTHRSH